MKLNRYLFIISILFFPSKAFNQAPCDSSSFKQLISFQESVRITDDDLNKCCHIVDSLLENNCTYFILKREFYNQFTLTTIFGDICIKANSINSVKAYINYYLKNRNSPEEQLQYSLGEIFAKRPKDVLNEIVMCNSSEREQLLFGLALGLCGTYNNISPIDTINYQNKFFSINTEIIKIYPHFKKEIDFTLNQIKNILVFTIKMENENK